MTLDEEALIDFTRQAMAAGIACFTERLQEGYAYPPGAPISAILGDFPAEFIKIRTQLVEALASRPTPEEQTE